LVIFSSVERGVQLWTLELLWTGKERPDSGRIQHAQNPLTDREKGQIRLINHDKKWQGF